MVEAAESAELVEPAPESAELVEVVKEAEAVEEAKLVEAEGEEMLAPFLLVLQVLSGTIRVLGF